MKHVGSALLAQGVKTHAKVTEQPPLRLTRIAKSEHEGPRAILIINYKLFCERVSTVRRVDDSQRTRSTWSVARRVALP